MNISTTRALVRIDYAPANKAWAKTAVVAVPADGRWVAKSTSDVASQFPPRGQVFWPHPDPRCVRYRLWSVDTRENKEADDDKDEWMVVSGEPQPHFVRILVESANDLRRRIASGSLELPGEPLGPVWLGFGNDNDEWLGPLDFALDPVDRKWKVGPVAGGYLEVVRAGGEDLRTLALGLAPVVIWARPDTAPESIRKWSCQDDATLLRSLLKSVKKIDDGAGIAAEVTQQMWRTYAEKIADLREGSLDALEDARRSAIATLLAEVEHDIEADQRLFAEMAEHPRLRTRLHAAIEARADAAEPQVRAALERRLGDVSAAVETRDAQLRALETELDVATKDLIQARASLQAEKARLDAIPEEVASAIEDAIQAVAREPIRELARIPVIRALLRETEGRGKDAMAGPLRLDAESQDDPTQVVRALRTALLASDLESQIGCNVVASVLSRRPIFLIGDASARVAELASASIAGGQAWGVDVPATVFGVGDLLRLPAVRLFATVGEVTTLGAALKGTDREVQTSIVLRGANRAPLEMYFDPIAHAQVSGGGLVAWSPEAAAPEPLDIGRAIVWLACLTDAPQCFQVPIATARQGAFIYCDRTSPLGANLESHPRLTNLSAIGADKARSDLLREEGWPDGLPPASMPNEASYFAAMFREPSRAWAEWLGSRGVAHGDDDRLRAWAGAFDGEALAELEELFARRVTAEVRRQLVGQIQ